MSEEEKIEEQPKDNSLQPTENNDSISEPSTITNQPPTENMEIHHHPIHHKSKPWKEYLLEGLMIFVAVTMGFFAESLREYFGDREKEKQNVENVLRCLKSDTAKLNKIIGSNKLQVKFIDSLLTLKGKNLHDPIINHKFYFYATNALFVDVYFKSNDAAMQQLKSSGMLRLIRKQKLIDELLQYEIDNRDLKSQQDDHYLYAQKSWSALEQVTDESLLMDTSKFNLSEYNYDIQTFRYSNPETVYITDDPKAIRLLYNNAAAEGVLTKIYILLLEGELEEAKSIISLIDKEYHIE
jgi:hypothetical protein